MESALKYESKSPNDRSFRYTRGALDSNWVEFKMVNGTSLRDSLEDSIHEGRYLDISRTGMRFLTRRSNSASVGDQLRVVFTPPGSTKSVTVLAEVVRKTGKFDFAVRFTRVPEREQKLMDACFLPIFRSLEPGSKAERWADRYWDVICLIGTGAAAFLMLLNL